MTAVVLAVVALALGVALGALAGVSLPADGFLRFHLAERCCRAARDYLAAEARLGQAVDALALGVAGRGDEDGEARARFRRALGELEARHVALKEAVKKWEGREARKRL